MQVNLVTNFYNQESKFNQERKFVLPLNSLRDTVSFGSVGAEIPIVWGFVRLGSIGNGLFQASKKCKLVEELSSVIQKPEKYTSESLIAVLRALTKLENNVDQGFASLFYKSDSVPHLCSLRRMAMREDFLKHVPDNKIENRITKQDLFRDYFVKAYTTESHGQIGLSALSDTFYSDFKKDILRYCLYSKTYFEKCGTILKGTATGPQHHVANVVSFIIKELDKNIYGGFIEETKDAHIKLLKSGIEELKQSNLAHSCFDLSTDINELIEELERINPQEKLSRAGKKIKIEGSGGSDGEYRSIWDGTNW